MNKKTKENWKLMSDKMDKRHKFLSMLLEQYPKKEQCPSKFIKDWEAFEEDGFKCWRDMPKVVLRLKKAARKAKKLDQNQI